MIDLLDRAGKLEEANNLTKSMEMELDRVICDSGVLCLMLVTCKVYRHNYQFGEYVVDRFFKLEPENPGAHVLLSNIYTGARRWDGVAIRTSLN